MTGLGSQHQIVATIDELLGGLVERLGTKPLTVLAQGDGVLKQVDQRLDERPHRLPREFLTEFRQFAEQVGQAALFGAIQTVLYFPRLTSLSCRQGKQPLGDGPNFLLGDPGA